MRQVTIKFLLIGVVFLGGCATTTDPSKGGLFSYNPAAYERRLDERENYLADAEAQHRSEQVRAASLESEVDYKSRRVSQQQQQVNNLRASVARDRQRLAQASASSNDGGYVVLQQRAASLESQVNQAEKNPNLDAKRAELARLQREHANLQRDINEMISE